MQTAPDGRYAHEIGHADGRPEPGQLSGADKRQNQTDEEVNQRHNSECLRATFLHDQKGIRPSELRPTTEQVAQGQQNFTQKGKHLQRDPPALHDTLTYSL
jgi:hypothetical protein